MLQNILYCPFGLKCGHELCKICALRSAGFTASLGDPQKLLARAPEEARCPECQLPGVFRGVIYLNQVDQMVKERQVAHLLMHFHFPLTAAEPMTETDNTVLISAFSDLRKTVLRGYCRFPVQWLGRQRDDKQRTAILKQIQADQSWFLPPSPAFSYGL